MDIAKIIREGREKLNLNQSQLAELVGVSPQAVQQWESGATQPRGKRLNKIAQVLKLPPSAHAFRGSFGNVRCVRRYGWRQRAGECSCRGWG